MKIRIIQNNIIPFKGFKAITLLPWIFCRKALKDVDVNHELIHVRQQEEMLIILFFIWYVIEWVIRLAIYWNLDEAYRNISFEQEAYDHEAEHYYLSVRKHFAWMRYIFKKSYEKF